MIRPALSIAIEAPAAPASLRITVAPSNVQPFAILDNGEAVAWTTSQVLAQRLADFLNWRHALDASEARYREAFLHA